MGAQAICEFGNGRVWGRRGSHRAGVAHPRPRPCTHMGPRPQRPGCCPIMFGGQTAPQSRQLRLLAPH